MPTAPYLSSLADVCRTIQNRVPNLALLITESRVFLDSLQHTRQDASASPSLLRAQYHQAAGFLDGIRGMGWKAQNPLFSSSDDPIKTEVRTFLGSVRRGEISSRGVLNDGAIVSADAFFRGAIGVFPEAASKSFLKTTARVWGKRAGSDESRPFSEEAGKRAGIIFKDDYDAGCAGGLATSVLDVKLHLRSVDDYLAVQGWFLGFLQFMMGRTQENDSETAKILRDNRSSVLYRALTSGQLDYPERVVQGIGEVVRNFNRKANEMEASNPETARVLRNNRSSVIYRTLTNGRFDYPGNVVQGIEEAVRGFDRKVDEMEAIDPETAQILRDNKASVISRALHSGQLDYPRRVVQRIGKVVRGFDRRVDEMDASDPETTRILRNGRGAVIYRVLANGQLDYPERAIQALSARPGPLSRSFYIFHNKILNGPKRKGDEGMGET